MAYISFDYKCFECEKKETRLVKKNMMDFQWCCGEMMTRLPAAPRTTFRFNDKKLKD